MPSGKWRPSCLGLNVLRSHSPEEFFIALAIGLLLKSNTVMGLLRNSTYPRDAPSQCETALQCNTISHWLRAYTEWSHYPMARKSKMVGSFIINSPNVLKSLTMKQFGYIEPCTWMALLWNIQVILSHLKIEFRSSEFLWSGRKDIINNPKLNISVEVVNTKINLLDFVL